MLRNHKTCYTSRMNKLLTFLLTLYPTMFLYGAIPSTWKAMLNGFAVAGSSASFFIHLAVFGIIFFIAYKVIDRYVSFGYLGGSKRGALGLIIALLLTIGVLLVVFYNLLPGNAIYPSPVFINTYILQNPFTFLVLALPFAYLFFN